MSTPNELEFAARLGIDAVAIFICAYAIYYRRYGRRDLLTAYVVFNIGLFAVVSIISLGSIGAGVGFGLFALLSIIRLRSEPFSNSEISYFFVALVIGVVDGLPVGSMGIVLALNVLVVTTVFVVDHPRLGRASARQSTRWQQVILDTIHGDAASLRADVERRLGVEIASLTVNETDYVRDVTTVTVAYRDVSRHADDEWLRAPVPEKDWEPNGNGNGHVPPPQDLRPGWSSIEPRR